MMRLTLQLHVPESTLAALSPKAQVAPGLICVTEAPDVIFAACSCYHLVGTCCLRHRCGLCSRASLNIVESLESLAGLGFEMVDEQAAPDPTAAFDRKPRKQAPISSSKAPSTARIHDEGYSLF